MPHRIQAVLKANKVASESINLLPVVITLISEQLDLYGATVLFSIVGESLGSDTYSSYSVPVRILHSCMPSTVRLCVCGRVFSKHSGCFSLAADTLKPSKACQSNTCNLLLNVRCVKYAHPPCLSAIPKPNLIIPACVCLHFHQPFSSLLP